MRPLETAIGMRPVCEFIPRMKNLRPIRHSRLYNTKLGVGESKVVRTRGGRRPGAIHAAQNLNKVFGPRRLDVRALRDVTAWGCLGHDMCAETCISKVRNCVSNFVSQAASFSARRTVWKQIPRSHRGRDLAGIFIRVRVVLSAFGAPTSCRWANFLGLPVRE